MLPSPFGSCPHWHTSHRLQEAERQQPVPTNLNHRRCAKKPCMVTITLRKTPMQLPLFAERRHSQAPSARRPLAHQLPYLLAPLALHGDDDAARPAVISVLVQVEALPRAERQAAAPQRHRQARAHQRGLYVRRHVVHALIQVPAGKAQYFQRHMRALSLPT